MDEFDRMNRKVLAQHIYESTPLDKIISIQNNPNGMKVKGYVKNQIKEYEVKM